MEQDPSNVWPSADLDHHIGQQAKNPFHGGTFRGRSCLAWITSWFQHRGLTKTRFRKEKKKKKEKKTQRNNNLEIWES